MNKKNKVLSYVLMILCVLCAVGSVFAFFQDVELIVERIIAVNALLCTLFAIFYSVKGYKKDDASYYKIYMILMFLFFQGCILFNGANFTADMRALRHVQMLGNSLLASIFMSLALSKDLGKKTAYTLLCIAQVLTFTAFATGIVLNPGIVFGGSALNTVLVVRRLSQFVLVTIACLMTKFKYDDKEARGTK